MEKEISKEIEKEIDKFIVGKGIIKCCSKNGTYYLDIESREIFEPEEILELMGEY